MHFSINNKKLFSLLSFPWTGVDISKEQIEQANWLSKGKEISYYSMKAEEIHFAENSFDVITACQCFWYFDHKIIMPKLYHMLKAKGSILLLYMAWLPFEDKIAGASEKLVLKYSPNWSGAGESIHPIEVPDCYKSYFANVYHEEFKINIPFTRESWNGRMKACRGVGASLNQEEVALWEYEHKDMLNHIAPEEFNILHYCAITELKKK